MIGRDRDVVDMLVMHGWFADGVIPNGSDARISRLFQNNSDLTGLYLYHVVDASWAALCATVSTHRSG